MHALITAKTILDDARRLIGLSSQHGCSAGLILLQDALEIVFLCCLKELGSDQGKSLESFSFDQLIGELGASGFKVPRSGTLKALNKQRVIVKHYGQLTDVKSTEVYLLAAEEAIATVLKAVIGKDTSEVFLSDLLPHNHALQPYLQSAATFIRSGNFLEALKEVRKAYFIEFERDYCVYQWRDKESKNALYSFFLMANFGSKAPAHCRDKVWISSNVREPVDYVRIDHDRLRSDAAEWGVSTSDLHNISQLTPQAVQLGDGGDWHFKLETGYVENNANYENASYCLDLIINVALRKYQHQSAKRWRRKEFPSLAHPVYLDSLVYERPDTASKVIHVVQAGYTYSIRAQLDGFDAGVAFLSVAIYSPAPEGEGDLGFGSMPEFGYVVDQAALMA
ncbi:hypothetical protein [Stenotrophomonas maltophilia]|uniref:hypothetical protein n=1 Tax=Stenotrophomonas maltophilia TaxID=40324 RepID=UPI0039F6FA39